MKDHYQKLGCLTFLSIQNTFILVKKSFFHPFAAMLNTDLIFISEGALETQIQPALDLKPVPSKTSEADPEPFSEKQDTEGKS